MTDYREIEQDPDTTDSDMMRIISEMIGEGWSLVDRKVDQDGTKTWVFQFG